MKKILAIILIALCWGTAQGANVFTTGNMTWSVLNPTAGDVVYVRAAHTLTVNVNQVGLSCAAIIDSGKLVHSAGSRINVGAIRTCGTGVDSLLSGSRMDVYNNDALGADDYQLLNNGKLYGRGATINGVSVSGTRPNFLAINSGQIVDIKGCVVTGFTGAYPNGGWSFTNFPATSIKIVNCRFDSASLAFINMTGVCLRGDTIKTYGATDRALMFWNCASDSVFGCKFLNDARGGNSLQQIYCNNTSNVVIWGCKFQSINEGTYTTSSSAMFFEGASNSPRIIYDTLDGFSQPLLTGSGGQTGGYVYGCRFHNGPQSHENIILHDGDNGWTVSNSTFVGRGARSQITLYCASGPADNFSAYYNTFVGADSLGQSSTPIAFEHTQAGMITYNGAKLVGNLLYGKNSGYNNAGILLGTTAAQWATVNFTEFKRNAFPAIYLYGSSVANYPYSMADSNLETQTVFGLVNEAQGDFRLAAGSAMKNAGDSTYGCQVYGDFRAATRPFNIGYDQNFYNRWNYGKHPWIRTAAICYGVTDSIAGHFIGRHNDLMINPGNTAYGSRSGVLDNARRADSMVKAITYSTISSVREQDNQAGGYIARFLARFPSYVRDSIYQWLDNNGGSVTLRGQQSSCGSQTNTINANDTVRVCGWTEANRKVLDFRQPAARQFVKFKAIDVVGGEQAKYDGPFFDEFSTYWAPVNYFNSPTNSTYGMVYPFGSGDWNPTTGFQRVRGWQTWTYAQIIDSCIKLKQRVWLKGVVDTLNLYGFKMFGNNSDYDLLNYPSSSTTNVGEVWFDAMRTGSGLTMYENGNSPWIYGNATRGDKSRNAWLWQVMDSINAWDTGQIICWHDIMPQESLSVAGLGGWGRCQMERLVFHYMAASNRCYFLLTSNMPGPLLKPNDYIAGDTLYKWVPAADRDVGQPTGARYVVATGTDGAGQAYTIYRRDYTNAIMLYRAASGNPGSVGASSAVVYNLGQIATPLNVNNTTGTQTTTASIRNMEGQIYLISATGDTTISVTGGSAVEGQPITFTVTLTTPSGLPLAASFDFTVNTSTTGSAQSNSDFLAQVNNVYTFSAGALSRTFTVTTLTDALTEGDETFTATISNPTLAGVKLGTATAIGTIVDVPPAPAATGNYLFMWRNW